MSLSETPTTPRKKQKRKPAPKSPAAPKPPSEMAGLTVDKCPSACNAEGCVISGKPYCSHPHKGGLQAADMHNAAALVRLTDAKRILGKRQVDARTS